jgi:hypothetical protein
VQGTKAWNGHGNTSSGRPNDRMLAPVCFCSETQQGFPRLSMSTSVSAMFALPGHRLGGLRQLLPEDHDGHGVELKQMPKV